MAEKKSVSIKQEIVELRQDFVDGRNFPLDNVKVEWCYLVRPDTEFNKSEWKVTILLEEQLAKSLAAAGFNVHKRTEDGAYTLVATRKTKTAKGDMDPPRVVGQDGETPFNGSKVGNGSVVNLRVYAKYWKVNGVWHLPLRLNSVQVVDLVEYTEGESGFSPVGPSKQTHDDVPF